MCFFHRSHKSVSILIVDYSLEWRMDNLTHVVTWNCIITFVWTPSVRLQYMHFKWQFFPPIEVIHTKHIHLLRLAGNPKHHPWLHWNYKLFVQYSVLTLLEKGMGGVQGLSFKEKWNHWILTYFFFFNISN
jgi:hypothetical protein